MVRVTKKVILKAVLIYIAFILVNMTDVFIHLLGIELEETPFEILTSPVHIAAGFVFLLLTIVIISFEDTRGK